MEIFATLCLSPVISLFTSVNEPGIKYLQCRCYQQKVITGDVGTCVYDLSRIFIDSMTQAISLSPVSMTPAMIKRRKQQHTGDNLSPVKMTPVIKEYQSAYTLNLMFALGLRKPALYRSQIRCFFPILPFRFF